MRGDARAGGDAFFAHLHLHRGVGWGLYGTLTVTTFVIGFLGSVSYLRGGQWWFAGLIVIGTLGVSGFLALITFSMVWPELTASAIGISGRMPRGGTVDASWSEVTIDVDKDAGPGTLRLDIGDDSVSVTGRAWVGFADFVWLVSILPQAAARLTPLAWEEVRRLLRIGR